MEWRFPSKIVKTFFTQSHHHCHRIVLKRTVANLSFKILGDGLTDPHETPILLFHDLLCSKKHWEGVGKTILMLTKRPVVVVDLRNHGDSPHTYSHNYKGLAKDILQLLNKLEVEKASLIGHSMGGMACMCVSLMAPHKVAGILIVDISPMSTAEQFVLHYTKVLTAMKQIDFKGFRKVRKAVKAVKRELKIVIGDDVTLRDVLTNVGVKADGKIGWTCNLDTLVKNFKNIVMFPKVAMKGKKYMGPALFVGGQMSDYLPPDDLPGIRELFPQAVITYVRGAGHNVHVDDPKAFLEFVIEFIRTND